jgi:hypothetical protein
VHIMTCREFKHSAAALTLWDLSRGQNEQVLSHADACETCEAWLRKQRSLASSMRMMQAQTAGLEAGPGVERALLKEFRRAAAAKAALAPAAMPRRPELLRPEDAGGFTPMAMRLSRFFEIGAYAAVAAAIMVGVFLGMQLLRHSETMPSAAALAPASVTPVAQKPITVEPSELAKAIGSNTVPQPALFHSRVQRQHSPAGNKTDAVAAQPGVAEASQASVDEDYIALMFCDPLSCSSDSQVVRMELPQPAGQDAQPQVADVVVGYDGVVRAVRIVN